MFVNRVFPPDVGATGQLLWELTRELSYLGWHISVVTGDNSAEIEKTSAENIDVHRVRGLPYRRKPLVYRALAYLSQYPALLRGIGAAGKPDLMVVMSDPPLFLIAASLYGRWKRIPIIHWSQDVYPDVAFSLGVMKRGSLPGRILACSMGRALDRCTAVIAVGGCMAERLRKRTRAPVELIPNWADAGHIRPVPHRENEFRRKLVGDTDRRVVMYSGNFGLGHQFGAIVQAMAELERAGSNALFVMIGEGPRLPDVKADVERLKLRHVIFMSHRPYSELSESLTAADLHLACLEPELLGLLVPSKVYGILAAGRPCIFLGPQESEAARFITAAGAGEVLPAGRQFELGARLVHWLDNPPILEEASRNARAAAEKQGLAEAVRAFDAVLRQVPAAPR